MRNASLAVLREIGVDTGGSNVQFAINPANGHMIIIEMNPRVSRSSALASKATGFPIAKVAAKLAVGYTLDELQNEITGGATPASFEPSIDYVVTKIPRFTFEKFPKAQNRLTTQMKSVGEVMAIGRTFQESMQKALRGMETGIDGFDEIINPKAENPLDIIRRELRDPGAERRQQEQQGRHELDVAPAADRDHERVRNAQRGSHQARDGWQRQQQRRIARFIVAVRLTVVAERKVEQFGIAAVNAEQDLRDHAPIQPHGEAAQQIRNRDPQVAIGNALASRFPEGIVFNVPAFGCACHDVYPLLQWLNLSIQVAVTGVVFGTKQVIQGKRSCASPRK